MEKDAKAQKRERMKHLRALLNEISWDLDRYLKEYRALEAEVKGKPNEKA